MHWTLHSLALLPPCSHHKRRAGQHHSSLLPLRARCHHPSKNSYRRLFVSYYALQVLLQLVTPIAVCFHTLLRLSLSHTSPSSCPGFSPYPSAFIIASPGCSPFALPFATSLTFTFTTHPRDPIQHGFGNCHGYHGRCWLQQAIQFQRGLFSADTSIWNVPI
jgi:hypothetical protein